MKSMLKSLINTIAAVTLLLCFTPSGANKAVVDVVDAKPAVTTIIHQPPGVVAVENQQEKAPPQAEVSPASYASPAGWECGPNGCQFSGPVATTALAIRQRQPVRNAMRNCWWPGKRLVQRWGCW